jgi:hypothetical protein
MQKLPVLEAPKNNAKSGLHDNLRFCGFMRVDYFQPAAYWTEKFGYCLFGSIVDAHDLNGKMTL